MTVEEWLGPDNQLGIDIFCRKYQYNNESFDEWLDRVSNKNDAIRDRILNKKFLFGGRILANRGLNSRGYANCNSLGYVNDNLKDIMKACSDLALTYKSGAGQGVNLSHIRCKGSSISSGGTTDGVIPFLKIMDSVTGNISRGGDRRGALLAMLDAEHGDILDFINVKRDINAITNANLSVSITKSFMDKVNSGDEKANQVFDAICNAAWDNGEPGIIFFDEFCNYNMMEFVEDYIIESCNGCSEIPMPKHSSCVLGNINLAEYVINPFTDNAKFDFNSFVGDIITCYIPAMDEIVTETTPLLPLPEQRECAIKWRPIGMGIMGVATALARMKIVYGSSECMGFLNQIGDQLFRSAIISSTRLAEKYGTFPGYDKKMFDSEIIKKHFTSEEIAMLKITGLRNSSLLSIPPSGSTSMVLGISTGAEPYFARKYYKRVLAGSLKEDETFYELEINDIKDAREHGFTDDDVVKYFITSEEIPWYNRVKTQEILQYHIDQAISSTINLPEKTTVNDIKEIYKESFNSKLKGITVFRSNCKRTAILNTKQTTNSEFTTHSAPKRPKTLEGDFYKIRVAKEEFGVFVGLMNGKPYEVFAMPYSFIEMENKDISIPNNTHGIITKIKKRCYSFESEEFTMNNIALDPEEYASWRAITLYISAMLRHGMPIESIMKIVNKCDDVITSFHKAIWKVLSKYAPKEITGEVCPECGSELTREGGCTVCHNCGFSKCLIIKSLNINYYED